ncbi:MFS transporter [Limibaculum sp. M0105]|uniref:MFS transporter n=1 Tax=Thermohalobaculum xanthum TaxID=2753746 RepID=A0A8J7M7D6_9RHOB|nr:MFS transporter [Thermohalobaculum xanthum]MBK0399934.1 MFS transporter [Thermohalobaculum xanthum]
MTEPRPNQFALLRSRRFLPLFLVQFLGAFNDQVYQKAFVALITYRLADQVGIPLPLLGVIASALFILPFAVVTPTAGQYADRVDKAVMMRFVKAWEIVVMILAVIGYHTQNIYFLYFVLFLMGAQSAVFAPLKYAVLPQYLRPHELLGGNGLVQGSTFLAIIFGTILGNELILTEQGVALVSIVVVAVAVAGFVASLFAPPARPATQAGPVDWLFPRAIAHLMRMAWQNRPAFRAIVAISWFWFLGATFLSLLPAYAKEELGADESVLTVLLAAFSVGVAIGALASERLGRGRVGVDLPPVGALGLAVMAIELWFATPSRASVELLDRAAFFSDPQGWRIAIDFVLIAAFAGMYVTPLNAVLQAEAAPDRRGQFIAASNVMDATFMVVSAGVVAVMVGLGLGTTEVLVLLTMTGLPMSVLVARYAPGTRLGRVALALWPRGPQ